MEEFLVTAHPPLSPDNPDLREAVLQLAEQTDLMALHCAVEAARAGDEQPAFGVAARELRRLAKECRDTADRIVELMRRIDPASRDADRCYSQREVSEAIENIRAICRLASSASSATRA